MKKTFLTLVIIVFSFCTYAQSFFTTSPYTNTIFGAGANNIFGWGENFDRTIDIRPNPSPSYGALTINYHTGLTFSAHSYYGGIRFYNQGYPNPYDQPSGSTLVMSITNGSVGIGTSQPDSALTVKGGIHAKSILVDQNFTTPDYVFDKEYSLATLQDVKTYIDQNHHLPEMPSAAQVAQNGINLGEMNTKLLKKIEELTLYMIQKDKEIKRLEKNNALVMKSFKKIRAQFKVKEQSHKI